MHDIMFPFKNRCTKKEQKKEVRVNLKKNIKQVIKHAWQGYSKIVTMALNHWNLGNAEHSRNLEFHKQGKRLLQGRRQMGAPECILSHSSGSSQNCLSKMRNVFLCSHRAWWLPLRASGMLDSFNLTLLEAEVSVLLWRCWPPPEGLPCDRCFNVLSVGCVNWPSAKVINGLFAQYSHLMAPWAAEMGWKSLHTAPETPVGDSACFADIPSPSTLQTNPSTSPNPSPNPNPYLTLTLN